MSTSTVFKKGEKRPNQGKRGPGKITSDVKDMVLKALTEAGGAEYLFMQSFDNPKAFLALVGRVIPLQVNGAGENGEHVFKNASDEQLLSRIKALQAKLSAKG